MSMKDEVGARTVIPSRIHEADLTGQIMPDESAPWPFINMSTETQKSLGGKEAVRVAAEIEAERQASARLNSHVGTRTIYTLSGPREEPYDIAQWPAVSFKAEDLINSKISAAIAAERERCAKIAEQYDQAPAGCCENLCGASIADLIRKS